jgi:hypothetical protein
MTNQEIARIVILAQHIIDYGKQANPLVQEQTVKPAMEIMKIVRKYRKNTSREDIIDASKSKQIAKTFRRYGHVEESVNTRNGEDTDMEINKYVRLFEMAREDLEGVVDVIKSGDFDKAASMYISKAKARGLDAKKVVMGLGSTFRTYDEVGPDEIKQLKEKIKEKLSGEMPEKKSTSKKAKKEEDDDAPSKAKEDSAKGTAKVKAKKVELIKKEREGSMPKEEPAMGEGTDYSRTGRLSLRDEILMRSGLISEEQMGQEGDAGKAFGGKKGKKKVKKFGKKGSMKNEGGGKGGVAKAAGKAPRKAENEEKAGEDREGLRNAWGLGNPGKYIGGTDGGAPGGGARYTGGTSGGVEGGGSRYTP